MPSIEVPKEKWSGKVREITLGATAADGGTRAKTVTVGGETTLPFLHFEGEIPHPPVIAMEVFDTVPKRYPDAFLEYYGDVIDKPGEMANLCVEEFGAELISVRLEATHPDKGDKSADEAAEAINHNTKTKVIAPNVGL